MAPRAVQKELLTSEGNRGPTRLVGVQALGRANILQVLMVRLYDEWLLGPLKQVSPLLRGQFNSKEPSVSNVVVAFSWEIRQEKAAQG